MKKLFAPVVVVLLLISLTFSSCGKYEDGPMFTVRTAKARLCQTWKPAKYIDGSSGSETSAGANDPTVTYAKDGECKITSQIGTATGTWEFTSDKTGILTNFSGITNTVTILRLTMKELWVKDSDGDKVYYEAQ